MSSTKWVTARPIRAAVVMSSLCLSQVWWTVMPTEAVAQDNKAKISEEQARQAAVRAVPGEITDVSVERKLGKNVYVVEIVAEKDGNETDVLVDMQSGKVLGVER